MAYGIDPTRVDTVAQYPLGMEADDPRTADFPGNRIRYIKAGEALGAGKALQKDVAVSAGTPSIRGKQMLLCAATTPLTQVVSAVSHVAIASGSFGWVTVKGLVPGCTVPDALAVGTNMIGGAAGAFVDASGAGTETAELDYTMAGGLRCLLVQDTGTSLGTVRID
jgi:hypothetical protein